MGQPRGWPRTSGEMSSPHASRAMGYYSYSHQMLVCDQLGFIAFKAAEADIRRIAALRCKEISKQCALRQHSS